MSNPPERPSAFAAVPGPTPLEYVQPGADGARRPGIVQALGIVSIVLACLQGLIALMGALSTVALMVMSSSPSSFGATSTTFYSPYGPTTAATSAATTVPTPAAPTTMPVAFHAMFGPSPLRYASIAMYACSFGLSIWLLVAGIQTVRGKRSGRRQHLRWAPVKVVLETVAAVIAAQLMVQMYAAVNATMVNGGTPGGVSMSGGLMYLQAYGSAGIQWVFSLLYPVAVWIVLTRRGVRQYFATVD